MPANPAPSPSRRRRRLRRFTIGSALFVFVSWLSACGLVSYLAGDRQARLEVFHVTPQESFADAAVRGVRQEPTTRFRVLTLNLAHGRRDGFHQMFESTERIRKNLDEVATILRREKPDLVALQEADGPSVWSGEFDHVEYLAARSGLDYYIRGSHVKGAGLAYGTAILSRTPLEEAQSRTFAPSPPTLTKGFVVARWRLPGAPERSIWVLSVHLDFLRESVRRSQVRELVEDRTAVAGGEPMILLGDFNCEWKADSALASAARKLDLKAWKPKVNGDGLVTFPYHDRRFDWILISQQLEFLSLKVLPDTLSDHRAVVADVTCLDRG